MSGGVLNFYVYFLGNVQKPVAAFNALHVSFLNADLSNQLLQTQQNIITQILKPSLQRKQMLARKPNAIDRGQGTMELFINEKDSLA